MPEIIFSLTLFILITGLAAFVIFNHINTRKTDPIEIKLTHNHKVIIFLFLSFLIVYYHPTKETMHCVGKLNCRTERTYLDSFTIKKNISLNSNSKLSCHIGAYSFNKKGNLKYGLYLRYNRFSPFDFYVADSSYLKNKEQKDELNKICKIYSDKFENYKKNYAKSTYRIESMANADKLAPHVLLIILLAYIFIFFEKNKYKYEPEDEDKS